eukprot:jgi/Mesen1/4626/ME000237S03665
MAGSGILGVPIAIEEHTVKRRRVERSGTGSGTEDDGFGAHEILNTITTPVSSSREDSLQTFSAAAEARQDEDKSKPRGDDERGEIASSSGGGTMVVVPVLEERGCDSGRPEAKEGGALADLMQTSGAYCSREGALKLELAARPATRGPFAGDGLTGVVLVGLKNIFARQLPNMPKEYIVRLVLDRSHKSMMIVKGGSVVGGITYRPYPFWQCSGALEEREAESAAAHRSSLSARPAAECWCGASLTAGELPALVVGASLHVLQAEKKSEKLKRGDTKYGHKYSQRCRGREFWEESADSTWSQLAPWGRVNEWGVPRRPLRPEDIPGIQQAGWSPEQSSSYKLRLASCLADGPPSRAALHAFLRSLLRGVAEHQDAWPFKEPVDGRDVPDYYDIIKDPIADMRRMFSNARTYNAPDTIYYKCANRFAGVTLASSFFLFFFFDFV